MKILAAIVAITLSQSAWAGICPAPKKHHGEGGGPIPESLFTEAEARKRLKTLEELTGPAGTQVDALIWENAFVIIEGWLLKQKALVPEKERDPNAVSDFCTFMKERAVFRD